ncbi:MAG: glycoside hydrolase family 16 protein [Pseudomonadota bacterium]
MGNICRRACTAAALMSVLAACSGGGSGSSSAPSNAPVSGSPPPPPPPPVIERPAVPDPAPNGPDFHPTGKGWSLVWSDEFDGTELDEAKWSPEEACWGGGNNEKQCYTARTDNVEVVNGLLRLIALEEEYTGRTEPIEWQTGNNATNTQPYTSGKVRTLGGRGDWTYGRFSMRAKLPAGQGTWPAFWMLPASDTYGNLWPLNGEMDIMEAVNLTASCNTCTGASGENRTSSAIHFGSEWPSNTFIDERTDLPGAVNPSDGYHVYSMEWGEGIMQFFVDDELHFTVQNFEWYTDHPAGAGNDNAPFDAPFYLIINLAIGGNFPEPLNDLGIAETALPAQLLVDWVRVYECTPDPETGLSCME